MDDREFASAIAGAIAGSDALRVPCPVKGCHWATYVRSDESSAPRLAEHLRTDPRHTNGEWIDRNGNERVGLGYAT